MILLQFEYGAPLLHCVCGIAGLEQRTGESIVQGCRVGVLGDGLSQVEDVLVLVALLIVCLWLPVILGLANAWLFSRQKAEKLQVTRGRAFGAYMMAVLMANALYLTFAVGYIAIVGATRQLA